MVVPEPLSYLSAPIYNGSSFRGQAYLRKSGNSQLFSLTNRIESANVPSSFLRALAITGAGDTAALSAGDCSDKVIDLMPARKL